MNVRGNGRAEGLKTWSPHGDQTDSGRSKLNGRWRPKNMSGCGSLQKIKKIPAGLGMGLTVRSRILQSEWELTESQWSCCRNGVTWLKEGVLVRLRAAKLWTKSSNFCGRSKIKVFNSSRREVTRNNWIVDEWRWRERRIIELSMTEELSNFFCQNNHLRNCQYKSL